MVFVVEPPGSPERKLPQLCTIEVQDSQLHLRVQRRGTSVQMDIERPATDRPSDQAQEAPNMGNTAASKHSSGVPYGRPLSRTDASYVSRLQVKYANSQVSMCPMNRSRHSGSGCSSSCPWTSTYANDPRLRTLTDLQAGHFACAWARSLRSSLSTIWGGIFRAVEEREGVAIRPNSLGRLCTLPLNSG